MSKQKLKEEVDFNFIRYANCWEDADVLLEALNPQAGDNILSIASAGDNSFAFLTNDKVHVHAIDINSVQIHLCELKKTSIQHLDYDAFLMLLGYRPSDNRWEIFQSIQNQLPQSTKEWCYNQRKQIEEGIIYTGKFEKYFAKFRNYILPLIHSKNVYKHLLQSKNVKEQIAFYTETFNNWRWQFLFKIFFSKSIMGWVGRDPEFLKQVNLNVGEYIYDTASKHLSSQACTKNSFCHFIFNGCFGEVLPTYVRPNNFENIKRNINNISFSVGYVQEAAIAKPKYYNKANLSNIFEYMPNDVFKNISNTLHTNLSDGAFLAYWNLMVNRNVSDVCPQLYSQVEFQASKVDNGFFYKNFNLNKQI